MHRLEIRNIMTELVIRFCTHSVNPANPSVLIIAAHPDDEVIGAGGRFKYIKKASFVHVTDGAPKNLSDAYSCGFKTRKGYAQARKKELHSALGLVNIRPEQCIEVGLVDQEASFDLVSLSNTLAGIIKNSRPEIVLTLAYEGGHPDHDASAFGAHAACRLLELEGNVPPLLVEYTSYFSAGAKMAVSEFLPHNTESISVVLSEEERLLKRRMVECFSTQQKVLSAFPLEFEKFRPAPLYDFTMPPHAGMLFYENFEWGMTGDRWRSLSQEALHSLGIEGMI